MEDVENMLLASPCAALDVWLGCIAAVSIVVRGFQETRQLSKTESSGPGTGVVGLVPTRHEDFENEQNRNLSYFMLILRLEETKDLGCHSLLWYHDYLMGDMKRLGGLEVGRICDPRLFCICVKRYAPNAAAGRKEEHRLCYHMWGILEGCHLQGAVEFCIWVGWSAGGAGSSFHSWYARCSGQKSDER